MTRERLSRVLCGRARRDPLLRSVVAAAREAGARVHLVGGAVRDAALGVDSDDVDLVADRRCRALVSRLREAWARRPFRFRKRGVTTWRFVVDGREVDLVDATRRGLVADLTRRDFTINAVAFDLLDGKLADPAGGLRDLERRLLRLSRPGVVREDPLRALRAARFLAQLPAFRLSPSARAESRAVARGLGRVSVERLRVELDGLLCSAAPSRGLAAIEELGLLKPVLPELLPLRDCPAGAGRADVWRHTLEAISRSESAGRLPGAEALGERSALLALRWALLLHDIAKPDTLAYRNGHATFHGHDALGARRADRLLRRLSAPRALRRRVSRIVALHLRPSLLVEAGASLRALRRLAREAGEDLPLLLVHAACDALGSGAARGRAAWKRLRGVLLELARLGREALSEPAARLVSGHDVMRLLGIEEGPRVGAILDEIRELQAGGVVLTREQALDYLTSLRDGRRAGAPPPRPGGGRTR